MAEGRTAAVLARISGRVQGVWFRGFVTENAGSLGVRGWVRNRSDGTVEALFVGDGPAVNEMLRRCRAGPPAAKVEHVNAQPLDVPDPEPQGFEQRPTE